MKNPKLITELISRFQSEWDSNDRGGIYALTQKRLAYNSNKIEGSTLTKDQTSTLFDTGSILGVDNEIYRAKDVEEMTGHFTMFNEMLKSWAEPLSEAMIKKYHYCLKAGVFEEIANGRPIGEFKNRPNIAGETPTASPQDVKELISALFETYNAKKDVTVDDIAALHERYEKIHPFQDGNGRTGRIIVFKECLKNNLIPIIVRDDNKARYINCLKQGHEGNLEPLSDYFKEEQLSYLQELLYFFPEFNIGNDESKKKHELSYREGLSAVGAATKVSERLSISRSFTNELNSTSVTTPINTIEEDAHL